MKNKELELDVDFIGGQGSLTKEEELAISEYFRVDKAKRVSKPRRSKKTARTARNRKVVA